MPESAERSFDLALLNCATGCPNAARPSWNSLLQGIPLSDFDFARRRMTPAIYQNLKQQDEPFTEQTRMRTAYLRSWATNTSLNTTCASVVAFLRGKDVRCLVLKGTALSLLVHKDLGIRPTTDIDLLIRPEQAVFALQQLESNGWSQKGQEVCPSEGLENAVSLQKEGVDLDLHWALLREARLPKFDQVLWDKAVPFEIDGATFWTLSPLHHFFHLFVVAHREPANLCRYLFDLHKLRQHNFSATEIDELHDLLKERHLLSRLLSLPLDTLGWTELKPQQRPSLLDRLWSEASRYVPGAQGEWNYALFPFLDYWLNCRDRTICPLGWWAYLGHHLQFLGLSDFLRRTWRKMARLREQN